MFSRHIQRRPGIARFLPLLLLMFIFALLSLSLSSRPTFAASPHVDVASLNSEINAASLRSLKGAINSAESDGASTLVIQINTPGGDIASMEAMKVAELNSTIPIISYVTPAGGWAASAGAFVTLAAQVAAMAPGTTIGASSPVDSSGGNLDSTMQAKVQSVLVSDMTSIQTRYGRNVDLATKMVTQAASYTDAQALQDNLIDVRATSLNDLLAQVNGRTVILASGPTTLHTSGESIVTLSASPIDSVYSLLLDPNVLFLLFIVAMIGIYAELSHPGMILPGVAGAIALILFLFGAGSIAPNWAGLALMALAFVLLVLDVRLPTHGVLTVGAVISLIFGALLFFNSGGPYQGPQVNPVLVYAMSGLVGLFGFYIVTMVVRTLRRPVTTGREGMIGEKAITITPLTPEGRVSYYGEDWSAVLDNPEASVDPNTEVKIVAVDGLHLRVALAYDKALKTAPTFTQEP